MFHDEVPVDEQTFRTYVMALGTRQTMTATGAGVPLAVSPQLFSVEAIKPNLIPAGEKRRVCMRLTMNSISPVLTNGSRMFLSMGAEEFSSL